MRRFISLLAISAGCRDNPPAAPADSGGPLFDVGFIHEFSPSIEDAGPPVFDGGDPFPQWEFHARMIKNPVKRWARLMQLKRLEKFCGRAIAEADLAVNKGVETTRNFTLSHP